MVIFFVEKLTSGPTSAALTDDMNSRKKPSNSVPSIYPFPKNITDKIL